MIQFSQDIIYLYLSVKNLSKIYLKKLHMLEYLVAMILQRQIL